MLFALLLILCSVFHLGTGVRLRTVLGKESYIVGATPQSSDLNQLVAGQTLVSYRNGTSFTFSFENAQLKINTSFIAAYTDLKYGYSVVLLDNEEEEKRVIVGSINNPVFEVPLQIENNTISQGAILDITSQYAVAYYTDSYGVHVLDLSTGNITFLQSDCAKCAFGGAMVSSSLSSNDIHIATTCNADAAFPFYIFTPVNESLSFPLACIFGFSSGKLQEIIEFDGIFDETYFDVHNWNPIITYNKVYATAIAAKQNVLATALTIIAKDGSHSNFLYFLDYISGNAVYYELGSIFGSGSMSSMDITPLNESFFVAIGIPDDNQVIVLNCTYDFNNCLILFNSTEDPYTLIGENYGSKVAFDDTTSNLIVSSTGDFDTIPGDCQMYKLIDGFYERLEDFFIPSLVHPAEYSFDLQAVITQDRLLVTSQDSQGNWLLFLVWVKRLIKSVDSCEAGYQWNSNFQDCLPCPVGQYKMTKSFSHCILCPTGTYSNISGLNSSHLCTLCSESMLCPAGSRVPLNSNYLMNTSFSLTSPDWVRIAQSQQALEFESSFYLSCVYYFVICIVINAIWLGILFFPWPVRFSPKTKARIDAVKHFVTKLNFFRPPKSQCECVEKKPHDWDVMGTLFSAIYVNIVLILIAFCIVFWKHHNITRQVSTNSLKSLPTNSHGDLIEVLDTSPFNITISFFGSDYSQCDKFSLSISGCETSQGGICSEKFEVCHYPEQNCEIIGNSGEKLNITELGVKSFCQINKVVTQGTILEGDSSFMFRFSDSIIPFYAEMILYQVIGKMNNGSVTNYLSDYITVPSGTILRGTNNIDISTTLTLYSLCQSYAGTMDWASFYRSAFQNCELEVQTFYNNSVKAFAPYSKFLTYDSATNFYNSTSNTFSLNFNFVKSQFFVAVNQHRVIEIGQFVTVLVVVLLGTLQWHNLTIKAIRLSEEVSLKAWKRMKLIKEKRELKNLNEVQRLIQ